MAAWDAARYLTFADERTRPARELLARVPLADARRVVDLGCGPGNSTALLVERFPEAEVIGVDSSEEMLVAARKRLPGVKFIDGDATRWTPDGAVDLIFANAVMQWVPDHLSVLERLLGCCRVLAIQVPDNFDEPTHRLMREVASAGVWRDKFRAPISRENIQAPRVYYDRLRPQATLIDIWHTVYNHALGGHADIVEWVSGTGLRPYLDRLDGAEQAAYLAEYRAGLEAAYPLLTDGQVLLRFPRLFMVAARTDAG